jgi:hypothetical protein
MEKVDWFLDVVIPGDEHVMHFKRLSVIFALLKGGLVEISLY